jgi:hypothetical protein
MHNRPKGPYKVSIVIWLKHYRDLTEFFHRVHLRKYVDNNSCRFIYKQNMWYVWNSVLEKPKCKIIFYDLVVFLAILLYKFLMIKHFLLQIFSDGFFIDSKYKSRSIKKTIIVIFCKSMLGRQGLSLILWAKSQFNIILGIIFQIFKWKKVLLTLILTTSFPFDSLHWFLNIVIISHTDFDNII